MLKRNTNLILINTTTRTTITTITITNYKIKQKNSKTFKILNISAVHCEKLLGLSQYIFLYDPH